MTTLLENDPEIAKAERITSSSARVRLDDLAKLFLVEVATTIVRVTVASVLAAACVSMSQRVQLLSKSACGDSPVDVGNVDALTNVGNVVPPATAVVRKRRVAERTVNDQHGSKAEDDAKANCVEACDTQSRMHEQQHSSIRAYRGTVAHQGTYRSC